MSSQLVNKNFNEWSAAEVADYIRKREDLKCYVEVFQKNKIDGKVAHRLTDADLKEMGVSIIGDRHKLMQALEKFKVAKEQVDREKILWTGREEKYWSGCEKCFKECCGICKYDKEQYTLRYATMELKKPDYNRCLGIKCCFGHKYHIDTVDLSNVRDVNVDGVPPPCAQQFCCCAKDHEFLIINMSVPENGQHTLHLVKGEGEKVGRQITNQVEIMQRMERS